MTKKAPVLFLIFNRPDLTNISFSAIQKYKPPSLYIAGDGPRPSKEGELELCSEARRIVEQIDWKCEFYSLFREENLGCKKAVSQAVSWFFDQEEKGIVLEDDILPDQSFFSFCEELLEKYRYENQISMISGDNFSFGKKIPNASYYFSRYSHIWGWATWQRAWKDYSVDLTDFNQKDLAIQLKKFGFSKFEIEHWIAMFNLIAENRIDTWDFQWVYRNFILNRLSIMPQRNLIENLGFRSDATHTSDPGPFKNLEKSKLEFPLKHPKKIKEDKKMDSFSRATFLPREDYSILKRLSQMIGILK